MTVELDDMKHAWQTLQVQLEQQQRLHQRLLMESRLDKMRHGLRPLVLGQSIQLAFGVAIMLWGISFWSVRMEVLHWLIVGVLVQLLGMSLVLAAARNLHLIQRIDYAAPILEIQQRLAALRAWRVRVEAPVFAVIGSFAWIPLVLMEIQLDDERVAPKLDIFLLAPWLVSHLILCGCVSLALVVVVFWLVRWAGHRRWLENNFAGKCVQKAESMLEQIAQFKQE
ncbi:hypothetical protein ISP18_06385 [Dyella humi]|uniref:Serine/threonine protein kinase n=1 Tax=Dyella humi TaxID=1770547 RepID=A0ABW8IG85_9GAMM